MTIKKYTGKTREEAIEQAKKELGSNVVIMNVKEIRPSGIFGIFKASTFEVTAALEEDRFGNVPKTSAGNHFDAVAGEKGIIEKNETSPAKTGIEQAKDVVSEEKVEEKPEENSIATEDLRDAFRAVNEVVTSNLRNGVTSKPVEKPVERIAERPVASKISESAMEDLPVSLLTENEKPKDNRQFVRMLYKVLLDNEVEERHVNQILSDMQKVIQSGASLDVLLSNVYQKMVLMLGQPHTIQISKRKPTVVFLIGPTGVGKTTTIAKIASRYKLVEGRDIALFTADTYRIAAAEQLQTYANILDIPLEVIMEDEDINLRIEKYRDKDLILVDTAGFSHRNEEQREAMERLLASVSPDYVMDVFLVLSATTRFRDMKEIIDSYKEFTDFHLIFTKLDETSVYGPILSSKIYANANLSYVTEGQNVPDDMEVIDIQKMVRTLLGGH